jgi:hypothetical protein
MQIDETDSAVCAGVSGLSARGCRQKIFLMLFCVFYCQINKNHYLCNQKQHDCLLAVMHKNLRI